MIKKVVAAICISISLGVSAPVFSETICIEEAELEQIITEEVNKGIDEAISIVVKEKDQKYTELDTKYQMELVASSSKDTEIKLLKKATFWSIVKTALIAGAVSFFTGVATGAIVAQ